VSERCPQAASAVDPSGCGRPVVRDQPDQRGVAEPGGDPGQAVQDVRRHGGGGRPSVPDSRAGRWLALVDAFGDPATRARAWDRLLGWHERTAPRAERTGPGRWSCWLSPAAARRLADRGRNLALEDIDGIDVQAQKKQFDELTRRRIALRGHEGTHADGRYGALFSANFDAVHGMFFGVEVGTRLDGRPALVEARRYFRHAMTHADLEFAPAPTQRDLDRSVGARWRQPWPYDPRLTVSAGDGDWRRLVGAAVSGPVLWAMATTCGFTSGTSPPSCARSDRAGTGCP
jgi:hypothetical protein